MIARTRPSTLHHHMQVYGSTRREHYFGRSDQLGNAPRFLAPRSRLQEILGLEQNHSKSRPRIEASSDMMSHSIACRCPAAQLSRWDDARIRVMARVMFRSDGKKRGFNGTEPCEALRLRGVSYRRIIVQTSRISGSVPWRTPNKS
jgi:hypothetical protein